MARIAIVMKVTQGPWTEGQIATWYDAEAPNQKGYGGPWGNASMSEHVQLGEGLDERKVVSELVPDTWTKEGESDVTEDPNDLEWTFVPEHYALVEDATKASEVDAADADAAVRGALRSAMALGNQIIEDFAAENIVLGITADGMTGDVLTAMAPVMDALRTGSLHEAIARAKAIPAEDKDVKYVTDARLLEAVNRMEEHLGIDPISATL